VTKDVFFFLRVSAERGASSSVVQDVPRQGDQAEAKAGMKRKRKVLSSTPDRLKQYRGMRKKR
jgi:hypothetical protein